MKSAIAGTLAVLALAGCGSSETDETDVPPAPATTYYFAAADIMRPTPRDICRQQDPDFALKLMGRVDAALPIEAKGSAQFDRFFVQDSSDGQGKEAVLWFTAHHAGKNGVIMFATAPFEPKGCGVGEMAASVGTDLFRDAGKHGFKIP